MQCVWQGAAATCWGQHWCRSLQAAQCIMEPRCSRWLAPSCRGSALPSVLALHCLAGEISLLCWHLANCSDGALGLLARADAHSLPAAPHCWLRAGYVLGLPG